MNQQAKLVVIILALLAFCGIGGAFFLFQDNQNNLRKFKTAERTLRQSLQALQEENATLRQNEQRLTDEQKALEEQKAIALEDLEQVKRELSKAKDEASALSAQLDTLKSEREALKTQVDKLSALQEDQERQLAQLRRSKSAVERTAAHLRDQLAQLEAEHQRLVKEREERQATQAAPPIPQLATTVGAGGSAPASVTLPPIIVQPAQRPAGNEQPAGLGSLARRNQSLSGLIRLAGRVVSVNPEHQFIVVDRGATDGVSVGDRFEISRNQRSLGTVTVIRVRESIAACDAKALGSQVRARVGDAVRWLPPVQFE